MLYCDADIFTTVLVGVCDSVQPTHLNILLFYTADFMRLNCVCWLPRFTIDLYINFWKEHCISHSDTWHYYMLFWKCVVKIVYQMYCTIKNLENRWWGWQMYWKIMMIPVKGFYCQPDKKAEDRCVCVCVRWTERVVSCLTHPFYVLLQSWSKISSWIPQLTIIPSFMLRSLPHHLLITTSLLFSLSSTVPTVIQPPLPFSIHISLLFPFSFLSLSIFSLPMLLLFLSFLLPFLPPLPLFVLAFPF